MNRLLILILSLGVFQSESKNFGCKFKYEDGKKESIWNGDCLCGPKGQKHLNVSSDYCCVSRNDECKIDKKTNTKWCENGKLLYYSQPCHGSCYHSEWTLCPTNDDTKVETV